MRPIRKPEVPQMMRHLISKLLGLLIGYVIIRHHMKVSELINVEAYVRQYRYQIIEIIGQGFAILYYKTPILSISKIILAQVGTSYEYVRIENMCLDMMNAKYFSEWTHTAFAFCEACIRVVPKSTSQIPLKMLYP